MIHTQAYIHLLCTCRTITKHFNKSHNLTNLKANLQCISHIVSLFIEFYVDLLNKHTLPSIFVGQVPCTQEFRNITIITIHVHYSIFTLFLKFTHKMLLDQTANIFSLLWLLRYFKFVLD